MEIKKGLILLHLTATFQFQSRTTLSPLYAVKLYLLMQASSAFQKCSPGTKFISFTIIVQYQTRLEQEEKV